MRLVWRMLIEPDSFNGIGFAWGAGTRGANVTTLSRTAAIDLVVWPLNTEPVERLRLASFLNKDEAGRAERFVFERDRNHFVVGRGRVRELLARRLACEPADVDFVYSKHGKPALASGTLHFNLSHAHGLAALALSNDFEVGIDIERVRPIEEGIAQRFFSPAELAGLNALPVKDQLAGFFRCWTRKEAIVKAIGEGLSRPLSSFDVPVATDRPAVLERLDGDPHPAHWQLLHFEPAPDFVGAIACRTGGAPAAIRSTPPDGLTID